ncbi:7-methylxanthosine synthase 1 isoform X2 [Eucalyptus grandis]|uniref:7-methylxanthosine synthase 1 isoform X2 n=1 Tax=Eucalyptus grandis TaxID=71139 RepID=UPI00192E75F5|nr:7-methylxanthosine synthase 1 isoform X2 [Eucalyptus grandis]
MLETGRFGCSSGPNALLVFREMIDSIDTIRKKLNKKEPMFQIFQNDLFSNDFNTLIRSIPSFYEELRRDKGGDFGPCFIAVMPGSYYGRLFPAHYLHFIHSSYSVHWRSQAPANLVSEFGSPLNKGHIYLARTTPKSVHEAYLDLFKRDMTLFLKSRSEELILGGRMLFTMIGRDASVNLSEDQVSNIYELLGMTISDMVQEGLIEEEKLDDWNMPIYLPTPEEVRHVIQKEGSFHITRFETFKVTWDAEMGDDDLQMRGKYAAATIRAVFESILTTHFGEEIMDGLFEKFASKVSQYMKLHEGEYFNILVSVKNG